MPILEEPVLIVAVEGVLHAAAERRQLWLAGHLAVPLRGGRRCLNASFPLPAFV
jgi:hypothetical protein